MAHCQEVDISHIGIIHGLSGPVISSLKTVFAHPKEEGSVPPGLDEPFPKHSDVEVGISLAKLVNRRIVYCYSIAMSVLVKA